MVESKSELEHKLAGAEESLESVSADLTSAKEDFSRKKEHIESSLKNTQDELQAKTVTLTDTNKRLCELQVGAKCFLKANSLFVRKMHVRYIHILV